MGGFFEFCDIGKERWIWGHIWLVGNVHPVMGYLAIFIVFGSYDEEAMQKMRRDYHRVEWIDFTITRAFFEYNHTNIVPNVPFSVECLLVCFNMWK